MMMMSSLKLVLIFGAALGLCHSFNAQNKNHLASVVPQYNTNITDQLTTPTSAPRPNPGFDYFVFVLQWPAAFCNIQRSYKQRQPCDPDHVLLKHRNKFTVHGLWPQLNSAQSPLFCKTTQQMQDTDLIAFQNDLLEYWPRLFSAQNFQDSMQFWSHEWDKHGTCSSKKFTPRQYLKITLDLAKKYAQPIFDGLQNKGIKPDGTTVHRLEDLRKIVMKLTGCNYPILNIVLNGSGDHLLLEIKLCVQNDGVTLMDCGEVYKFSAP